MLFFGSWTFVFVVKMLLCFVVRVMFFLFAVVMNMLLFGKRIWYFESKNAASRLMHVGLFIKMLLLGSCILVVCSKNVTFR